jgi:hypothetical protein
MSKTNWGVRALWIAGGGLSIYAWTDFLWPPVSFYRHKIESSPISVLAELIQPHNKIYPNNPLSGYAFLILTFGLVVWVIYNLRQIIRYLDISFKQLSILDSKFDVKIHDVALTRATMRRVQNFHANRSNISAYRQVSTLDAQDARIDVGSLNSVSTLNGASITKERIPKNTKANLELIEVYNQDLPTSITASLLPNDMVRALFNLGRFKGIVVTRIFSVDFINEYNGEHPSLQATATDSWATNVVLRLDFPEETAPDSESMSCFLIMDGAVRRLDVQPAPENGNRVIYEVRYGNLYKASIRLQWTNEKLRKYLASQQPEKTKPASDRHPKDSNAPKRPRASRGVHRG